MSSGNQAHDSAQSPQLQDASLDPTVPLVCHICQKVSRFSDLSHLLTHMGSKGHLHNQFQMELQRDVDNNAKAILEQHDTWYKDHNIGLLLRNRMSLREQRDTQQRQNQTSLDNDADNATIKRQGTRGGRSTRRGRGNIRTESQNRIGLGMPEEDSIVKYNSDDDKFQQGNEYSAMTHDPYGWHQDPIYMNRHSIQYQAYGEDEDDSSKLGASEDSSLAPLEEADDTGRLLLKGAVYPGMGGFDSATERDRRLRNQKKDPTVLMKLEANASKVTRAEAVRDMNLEIIRARDVYDEPSIFGSDDDDDDDQPRARRRSSQVKSSYATPLYGRTRKHGARLTLSTSRRGRGSSCSTTAQSNLPMRNTHSSAHRQEPFPLHSHGVHPNMGTFREYDEFGGDEDFRTHVHTPLEGNGSHGRDTPVARNLRGPHEHLQGLALRPGNPNATFVSPTPGYKKTSPHFAGKENTSFNPYFHTSGETLETNNYNPLCPQPGDGMSYRMYAPYQEEHKQPTSSGFNPINNPSSYDPAHDPTQVPGVVNNSYQHAQPGGDEYPL